MKSFKSFSQALNETAQSTEEIEEWMKRYGVKGKIVNGHVECKNVKITENIKSIDVTFSKCIGAFEISLIMLRSLKGCPTICGEFNAGGNNLKSLVGGPLKTTKGDYLISSNKDLESLEGGPIDVNGTFFALYCGLKSKDTIRFLPERIGENCLLQHNQLTDLKDIHKQVKHIGNCLSIGGNPIKSHMLGVLLINGLQKLSSIPRTGEIDPILDTVVSIINKYLLMPRDKANILACQEELIDEDLDDFAEM